jgi:hypothetical protein
MKTTLTFLTIIFYLLFFTSCINKDVPPRSKHVILIGLDGMGAYGFQRAATPFMNNMAKNGALSVKARSVLVSDSSPNWASMLTGAIPIQHGVTSNDWRVDNHNVEPSLKNKIGLFPSIFDDIKSQKPDYKVYAFRQGPGLGRMFDSSVPDTIVSIRDGKQLINEAIETFIKDKPEFLFIAIGETDHVGHVSGHESQEFYDCISKYDSLIGKFADRLKEEKMLDNTVMIITADHGGIGISHGGETPYEMEIPILLYGGSVTKGKVIEEVNIIPDVSSTIAGLSGVKMPRECVGKFIYAAFEPKTDVQYAPVPVITPLSGLYKNSVGVSLRADSPDAKIFYTLDNSEPTGESQLYEKPFVLNKTTTIKAVTMAGKTMSRIECSYIRITNETDKPAVRYKLFENYNMIQVPDFKTLGKPDQQGLVYEFSLAELNINDKDHLAVQFSSAIQIDDAGEYTFSVCSDDGSKLYIDDKLVVDNDGSHTRIIKPGKITLDKGIHEIRIDYFEDYGTQFLEVTYESSSVPKQIIPFNKLK